MPVSTHAEPVDSTYRTHLSGCSANAAFINPAAAQPSAAANIKTHFFIAFSSFFCGIETIPKPYEG